MRKSTQQENSALGDFLSKIKAFTGNPVESKRRDSQASEPKDRRGSTEHVLTDRTLADSILVDAQRPPLPRPGSFTGSDGESEAFGVVPSSAGQAKYEAASSTERPLELPSVQEGSGSRASSKPFSDAADADGSCAEGAGFVLPGSAAASAPFSGSSKDRGSAEEVTAVRVPVQSVQSPDPVLKVSSGSPEGSRPPRHSTTLAAMEEVDEDTSLSYPTPSLKASSHATERKQLADVDDFGEEPNSARRNYQSFRKRTTGAQTWGDLSVVQSVMGKTRSSDSKASSQFKSRTSSRRTPSFVHQFVMDSGSLDLDESSDSSSDGGFKDWRNVMSAKSIIVQAGIEDHRVCGCATLVPVVFAFDAIYALCALFEVWVVPFKAVYLDSDDVPRWCHVSGLCTTTFFCIDLALRSGLHAFNQKGCRTWQKLPVLLGVDLVATIADVLSLALDLAIFKIALVFRFFSVATNPCPGQHDIATASGFPSRKGDRVHCLNAAGLAVYLTLHCPHLDCSAPKSMGSAR
jgi:hypothetical protein